MGTLLIADDREEIRYLLQEVLEGSGHTVLTAAGGEETLQTLKQAQVDLILLDMKMNGMDGLETLKAIKKTWPAVAVIMMTACEDEGLLRETVRWGAGGYIQKPFDLAEVQSTVAAELLSRADPSALS